MWRRKQDNSSISSGTEENPLGVVDVVGTLDVVEVALIHSPASEIMDAVEVGLSTFPAPEARWTVR